MTVLDDLAAYAAAVKANTAAALPQAAATAATDAELAASHQIGTFAARPAAAAVPSGTLYFATDATADGGQYRSNGAAWTRVGPSLSGTSTTVATDTIWDADSDLAVGTGADTAARLAVPASRIVGRKAAGSIGALTAAEVRTILDVPTNAEAILDTLVDANSILYGVTDDTPAALAVPASRIVGRKAAGDIAALTGAEVVAITRTSLPVELCIALSDETTALTTGAGKAYLHLPFAMTVTSVFAEVNTVSSSGLVTVDINEGAGAGTTILSTKLSIDASEESSDTAATPAVISDASLAQYARLSFDIDAAGTGAKGLKVWLIGTRTA